MDLVFQGYMETWECSQRIDTMNDSSENEKKRDRIAAALILFIFLLFILVNIPRARYVVNLKSGRYHLLNCQYGKKINPENKKFFSSLEEVTHRDFQPCSYCRPRDKDR
jgi:hypothetical protein